MTALSIQPTFPTFTDSDGTALDDGYIWIGVAGSESISTPLTAYWDAALTQVVTQPVRTRGGYPLNAGAIGRLYVNSNYSIKVRNRNGFDLYSSLTATERYSEVVVNTNASQVVYNPAGTGAVATTVQTKLRESVSVKDFGAKGDGSTNDTAALNAAYTAAEAAGGVEVYWPAGTYKTTGTVTCGSKCSTRAPQAILSYTGSGVAFDIQGVWDTDAGVNKGDNISILPVVIRASLEWNAGTDSTSVGIRIANRKMTTFFVRGVQNFYRGLVLESTTANTVCNTFHIGLILNNQYGIDFGTVAPGFGTNQNQFIGGQVSINSPYTAVSPRISVNMPNAGENNTNLFLGVNLEKGGNEKAIVCASPENIFLNCRFEGSASTLGYITISGNRNKIIGGAPDAASTLPYQTWISDTGFGNQYWMGYIIASKSFALDFSSSTLPLRFGNGTAFPAVPVRGFGTDRLSLGDSNTVGVRYNGYMMQEEIITTSGTTIPAKQHQQLNYAAPATITNITGGFDQSVGGVFSLIDLNGNITLQHTAGPAAGAGRFVLTAGVNLAMTANRPVLFVAVNGNLYEA